MNAKLHVIVRPGGVGDSQLLAPALARLRSEKAQKTLLVGYPERLAPLVAAGLAEGAFSLDQWMVNSDSILHMNLGSVVHRQEEGKAVAVSEGVIDTFFPSLPQGLGRKSFEVRTHPAFPIEGSGIHVATHLAESLGVQLPAIPEAPLATLVTRHPQLDRSTLWIHPGAGNPAKRWPVRSFLEVATQWTEKTHSEARFLLGEADLDLQPTIDSEGFSVHFPPNPLEMSRLFSRKDIFLGNDSGPTHLAALMGLRTIAIFLASDPDLWRPWGSHVTVLTSSRKGGYLAPDDLLTCLHQVGSDLD